MTTKPMFTGRPRLDRKPRPRPVEFNTRSYEFTYGHPPRGRGSWAFAFEPSMDIEGVFWTPGSTTYGEAKKLAAEEARRRGASEVWVCS